MKTVDTLILGGGPAGLALGRKLGADSLVLERNPIPGGMCRSFEWGKALFDFGGHILTTKHKDVIGFISQHVELFKQRRNAVVSVKDQLIPYPFQQHFHLVNDRALQQECCEKGEVSRFENINNFEQHLNQKLGKGIFKHFGKPYNEKLWGAPLDRISASWANERVAPVNGKEPTVQTTEKLDRDPLTSDTQVAYPAFGGFGEIFSAIAREMANIEYGKTVVSISLHKKQLTTSDGDTYCYNRLVYTLPLTNLNSMCNSVPVGVNSAINSLEILSLRLVLLRLHGQLETDLHRIYSAASDVPWHKLVLPNTSSPCLRIRPVHGIMAEVSDAHTSGLTDDCIVEKTIESVENVGVASRDDIEATKVIRIPFAYPVQTHAKQTNVGEAKEWLKTFDVYLLGRFAEWDYINSDQVILRAMRLAEDIKNASTNFHKVAV